jgi:TRAP-type C4-dicarboxylate transport system substrate-binding protein
MKMKLAVTYLIVIAIANIYFAPPAISATRPLKLGTVAPDHSSFHNVLLHMRDDWHNSGVELKIYPGGVLGGEAEMVRRMRTGGLDAALLTVNGLAEIDSDVEALQNLPMMFHSLDEVDHVSGKLRARMEKKLRDKGFVVLFWTDAGWVRFFSKERLVHPDDLRKMKLFTWAGDLGAIGVYRAGGFNVIPLETSDIAATLQTGLINAVPLPPYVALTTQVYSLAPHMLDIPWAPLVGALVVSERSWNAMSPDVQRRLAQAASIAGKQMKERNRIESEEAIHAMASRGLVVERVTPEVEEEWRRAAEQSYRHIRGEMVPADLFDEVRSILTDYRASQPRSR